MARRERKMVKINFEKYVLVSSVLILLAVILFLKPSNDSTALCIDCAPDNIGGGCTYTDENGKTVQPEACVPYNTTKTIYSCPEGSHGTKACILLYSPVCGNDAKTYSNSCFACSSQSVSFYIEGQCEDAILK
ncbi:MAG TPA: Kazal-type serine protease inhibitor domain-containing protein [archaeon]|nr:Kazal-type serine protease inhibitor domain-containing protein [archaeon]